MQAPVKMKCRQAPAGTKRKKQKEARRSNTQKEDADMKLKVDNHCAGCSYCYRYCPVGAPYFDGIQTQINNGKCISCGICVEKCPLGAIYDEENPPRPAEPHEKKTCHADAVIVGAGASGMVAAVRLAEKGKKVLVLEKAKRSGAAALHVAGPMQIIDTQWAKEAGEKPKAPERIRQILEYGQGHFDPELVEKTVYALPRLFDWMCTFTDMGKGFVLREGRMGPPPMDAGSPDGPGPEKDGQMPAPGQDKGKAGQAPVPGTGVRGSEDGNARQRHGRQPGARGGIQGL